MTNRPDFHIGDTTRYTMLVRSRTKNRPLNLSAASSKQIRFEKPDGTTFDRDATFTTDGSDGKIYYEWQANELDTEGKWYAQAMIVDGGKSWSGDIEEFEVGGNIADPP